MEPCIPHGYIIAYLSSSLLTFSSWYVQYLTTLELLRIKLLRFKNLYPYIIYCKPYLVCALSNSNNHSKTFANYIARYNR